MKTRLDFVTNSSSSSFIICKEKNYSSIEEVFLLLKSFYNEYLKKRTELIEYCKHNEKFEVSEKDDKINIRFIDEGNKEKRIEERDFTREQFGMTWSDYFNFDLDWLKCETYEDFVEYTKINNVNIYIVDFLNPKFEQGEDIDLLDSVIEWYMPCFKGEYSTDCEKCGYKKYCDIQTFGKETVSNINKAKNTNEIFASSFGRFCVCSECGYMPNYVVEKLGKASSLYCNHMG
jgi:hypothetical protein